ncbi:unnamed protein product [Cladocopium goreaui]|uniref:Uncharacterized protein n=1 Tax=Cladocopium goreaui TaxID=2562237 RepID=A0A9P1DBF9_9DINO|nr:unnamed protein product [Cladocopium goreaui]
MGGRLPKPWCRAFSTDEMPEEVHQAPRRAGLTRQSKGFDELAFDKPLLADSVDLRGSWDETTMPRSNVPTAESSKQAEFVLPDRRAVAAALQRAEAVPALLTGPREVRRAPLAPPRLQVEEDWPEEARAEFLLAFQQQMDAIREEDEKKAKQERQELWETIVHHLVGQWQGDGQDFTVQQVGDALKVRRERGGSRQSAEATLWLDNRGRVVWGKHQSVLVRSIGSKEIQWCRRTVGKSQPIRCGPVVARNGQVLRWQKLTEDSVEKHRFSRWFSVRWESLAKPKGPQKRLAEVERKLGELILYEAQRYHNKHLCFLPKAVQNRALWDEVFSSCEAAVRNSDLMQLVAEIAAYEDFVDEGNYNVVLSSEQFWHRSQLGVKEANLLLLATPALQAQVLHTWRPKEGLSQEARGRALRNFMGQVGPRLQVSSGMNSPQLTRRRKELQPRCIETVLGLLSQAQTLRWSRLRLIFLKR